MKASRFLATLFFLGVLFWLIPAPDAFAPTIGRTPADSVARAIAPSETPFTTPSAQAAKVLEDQALATLAPISIPKNEVSVPTLQAESSGAGEAIGTQTSSTGTPVAGSSDGNSSPATATPAQLLSIDLPAPPATLTLAPPTETPSPTATPETFPTATWTAVPPSPTPEMVPSLRELAEPYKLLIGSAASPGALKSDPTYAEVLAREFNILTPENHMKFAWIHPARDRYDFTQADALVAFAQEHGMAVRGHSLVWDQDLPDWLLEGNFSREELISILREHILTVVGHYRGQVAFWDVVNEGFDERGVLRNGFWLQGIGTDYIELAFQWAHEADPDASLFYNDYGIEGFTPKSHAVYYYLRDLRERNIPVDGIGLQFHIGLEAPPLEEVRANMERFAALGMQVHITEMDVRVGPEVTREKLFDQAQVYGDILSICLSIQSCKAFEMWGVTDKYSWIPSITGATDAPLILDSDYWPKPAYNTLWNILLGKR